MKSQNFLKNITLITIFIVGFSQLSEAQKFDEHGFPVANSIVGPRWGADSISCVTNFSLYRENYRQWRGSGFTNDAINYTIDSWRYVFLNCPLASQNTYIDGSKIIEHLYKKETDTNKKKLYIDTLMMLYNQWVMAFGNDPTMGEGFILGRKGIELLNYSPNEIEKAYKIFEKAFNLSKGQSEPAVLFNYFFTLVRHTTQNNLDNSKIFEVYDEIYVIIEENKKNIKQNIEFNPADKQRLERQLASFESSMTNINAIFEPLATCENLENIYGKKFKANPANKEMLERLISAFDRKNCTSQLYYDASEALYRLSPTAESAFALARMYFRLEDFTKAISFSNEVLKLSTDNNLKADVYLMLTEIYRIQRNFPASRTNALRAAELRPNDGRPYMIIGDLYAASAAMCPGDKIASKAIFWAALDKYIKARNADESIASQVNTRISNVTRQFPSTEDLFFHGHKKGDTFKVECWINEVTTIRSSD